MAVLGRVLRDKRWTQYLEQVIWVSENTCVGAWIYRSADFILVSSRPCAEPALACFRKTSLGLLWVGLKARPCRKCTALRDFAASAR
jgi:hypothetical protein